MPEKVHQIKLLNYLGCFNDCAIKPKNLRKLCNLLKEYYLPRFNSLMICDCWPLFF